MARIRIFKDSVGRTYYNIYMDFKTNGVLSYNGKNEAYKGTPKFTLRKGSSEFGEELIIQLNIDEQLTDYNQRSKHNTLEIYIPLEQLKELKKAFGIVEGIENESVRF